MITKFESYEDYSAKDEPDFGDIIIKKDGIYVISLSINNSLTEIILVFDPSRVDTYHMEKREIKEFYTIEEYYRNHPEIYNIIPLTTDNSHLSTREVFFAKLRDSWLSKVPDFKMKLTASKYNI